MAESQTGREKTGQPYPGGQPRDMDVRADPFRMLDVIEEWLKQREALETKGVDKALSPLPQNVGTGR
jgi:hypothetical protein